MRPTQRLYNVNQIYHTKYMPCYNAKYRNIEMWSFFFFFFFFFPLVYKVVLPPNLKDVFFSLPSVNPFDEGKPLHHEIRRLLPHDTHKKKKKKKKKNVTLVKIPASILYKSIARRYRPVSYPDGPVTARYRFIKKCLLIVYSNIYFV